MPLKSRYGLSFVPQLGDCYGRAKLQAAARARRVKESAQSVRRLTLMQRLAGWFSLSTNVNNECAAKEDKEMVAWEVKACSRLRTVSKDAVAR